jgi:hypothetical protein
MKDLLLNIVGEPHRGLPLNAATVGRPTVLSNPPNPPFLKGGEGGLKIFMRRGRPGNHDN